MTVEIRDLEGYFSERKRKLTNRLFELAKLARSGRISPEKAAVESVSLNGASEELDLFAERFGVHPYWWV